MQILQPPPVPPKPWKPYAFPQIKKPNYTPMTLVCQGPTVSATPGILGLMPFFSAIVTTLATSPLKASQPGKAVNESKTGRRGFDPFTDHDFYVTIDGIEVGAFQKFDGLSWECDVIEYRDSMDEHPHKRPGLHRFGNIKLTKGMIKNTALYDWCTRVSDGDLERRNGAIHVLERHMDKAKPVLIYEFFAALPIKWSSFRADGKGSGTILEELELAVDSFNMKK